MDASTPLSFKGGGGLEGPYRDKLLGRGALSTMLKASLSSAVTAAERAIAEGEAQASLTLLPYSGEVGEGKPIGADTCMHHTSYIIATPAHDVDPCDTTP